MRCQLGTVDKLSLTECQRKKWRSFVTLLIRNAMINLMLHPLPPETQLTGDLDIFAPGEEHDYQSAA